MTEQRARLILSLNFLALSFVAIPLHVYLWSVWYRSGRPLDLAHQAPMFSLLFVGILFCCGLLTLRLGSDLRRVTNGLSPKDNITEPMKLTKLTSMFAHGTLLAAAGIAYYVASWAIYK